MSYVFLSGGTGTPKLLQGMRQLLHDEEITVITNPGDDYDWHGLRVCPDLDTILYLFSERLDTEKFWGVKNDSFHALDTLRSLRADTWFQVGDFDLGLHVFRTSMLNHEGTTIQDVINVVSKAWRIRARVFHATINTIRSYVHTSEGILSFQEFWVKHRGEPEIKDIQYKITSDVPLPPQGLISAIINAKAVIIGPSNPVTSITPILQVPAIKKALITVKEKVVVVSPFQGGNAFSGPAARMMQAKGFSVDIEGLYAFYKDIASNYIIHYTESRDFTVPDASIYRTETFMRSLEDKTRLAQEILDLFG